MSTDDPADAFSDSNILGGAENVEPVIATDAPKKFVVVDVIFAFDDPFAAPNAFIGVMSIGFEVVLDAKDSPFAASAWVVAGAKVSGMFCVVGLVDGLPKPLNGKGLGTVEVKFSGSTGLKDNKSEPELAGADVTDDVVV